MPGTESRLVRPPLTAAMLAPLEPGCRSVHLNGGVTDSEAAWLAEIMQPRPDVKLLVSATAPWDACVAGLDFLRFFPWLEWLYVSCRQLRNLDGLTHLPQLRSLYVTAGLHRLPAVPLAALAGSLRHLSLEGPVSRAGALSALTGLITLTLRSVSMADLSALTPMTSLRGLDLKLDGTWDLSLLPSFARLQYFEASRPEAVRLTHVHQQSGISDLQYRDVPVTLPDYPHGTSGPPAAGTIAAPYALGT